MQLLTSYEANLKYVLMCRLQHCLIATLTTNLLSMYVDMNTTYIVKRAKSLRI